MSERRGHLRGGIDGGATSKENETVSNGDSSKFVLLNRRKRLRKYRLREIETLNASIIV